MILEKKSFLGIYINKEILWHFVIALNLFWKNTVIFQYKYYFCNTLIRESLCIIKREEPSCKRFASVSLANVGSLSTSRVASGKMEEKLSFAKYCPAPGSMIGSVSYWPRARAGQEQKEDLRRSWDGHWSWISELRRADAARARSSQCCLRGDSSDHWSLSQEGTQKGRKTGCHLPGRTGSTR